LAAERSFLWLLILGVFAGLVLLPVLAGLAVYRFLAPTDFWERAASFVISALVSLAVFLIVAGIFSWFFRED